MDGEHLQKRKDAIRAEYWFKVKHYQAASDDGMPGANGNSDTFRTACLAEAFRAGEEIGLTREEVAALLGTTPPEF